MAAPGRPPRKALDAYVRDVEWLSASTARVVLEGGGLGGFAGPGSAGPRFADAYVKLVFLDPSVAASVPDGPLDLDALRAGLPSDRLPRLRTYTVRAWDRDRAELTLDVVVHGESGLAGPWAAGAKPGDRIFLLGPGGGFVPDPAAGFHLYVGDASVVPAIAVALDALPREARGSVLIEVDGASDEYAITHPDGVEVTWLHTGGGPVGSVIVPAVLGLRVEEDVQAFVHGEAGFVRAVRRRLRAEWGLDPGRLSVSGYWRLGADDEQWRATKRDWLRATEADDR